MGNKKIFKLGRWCKICKIDSHWTDNCYKIKNLAVRCVEKEVEDNEPVAETKNKDLFNYSLLYNNDKSKKRNMLKIKIGNKYCDALLDTGSDINILCGRYLTKKEIPGPFGGNINAANSTKFMIKGIIRNKGYKY